MASRSTKPTLAVENSEKPGAFVLYSVRLESERIQTKLQWPTWLDSLLQNAGTEMLGAFLTFFLTEVLRGSRKKREAAEQEAEKLEAELERWLKRKPYER